MKLIRVVFGGGTPKIFGVLCPPTIDVLLHFYYQIFKIWSFMPLNFFRKISQKISEIFSTFSKSKQTVIFVPKLVQNHYIDQN